MAKSLRRVGASSYIVAPPSRDRVGPDCGMAPSIHLSTRLGSANIHGGPKPPAFIPATSAPDRLSDPARLPDPRSSAPAMSAALFCRAQYAAPRSSSAQPVVWRRVSVPTASTRACTPVCSTPATLRRPHPGENRGNERCRIDHRIYLLDLRFDLTQTTHSLWLTQSNSARRVVDGLSGAISCWRSCAPTWLACSL